jgi:transposase
MSERRLPAWGAVTEAPVAAALGTSSFGYAEAYESQDRRCLERGHIHSFEYIEGVPAITCPTVPRPASPGAKSPFSQIAETKGLLRKV